MFESTLQRPFLVFPVVTWLWVIISPQSPRLLAHSRSHARRQWRVPVADAPLVELKLSSNALGPLVIVITRRQFCTSVSGNFAMFTVYQKYQHWPHRENGLEKKKKKSGEVARKTLFNTISNLITCTYFPSRGENAESLSLS